MSQHITEQREVWVYPTESVLEVAENYDPERACYPFSGDELAYYFQNFDQWPVHSYLP